MKKYLVEFIGTFFLALTVATAAVLGTAGDYAPIAIGVVLMIMIYAGGHVSGGHFNPAVTLGVLLRGRCERRDVLPYIVAQLAGAFVGGVAAQLLVPAATVSPTALGNTLPVLLAEFLFTFALVYVVLNAATAKGTSGNSFYGAAIGLTVMVGAFTVGPISLGGFNPAVSLMLVTVGKLKAADVWMHLLPQIIGACAAAFAFRAILPDDK
jgi:aquaporin Z